MQQLTQKLNNGEMLVQEVPAPQLGKGMILVKNHYSLISAGTESSTVKAARKSLIGKAKERPQQVKQVLDRELHGPENQRFETFGDFVDAIEKAIGVNQKKTLRKRND